MAKRSTVAEETRPGHGTPADWLSLGHKWAGRQVRSERHQRVEITEQDLGLRVRCHDCGAMARQEYRSPIFDAFGDLAAPLFNPLPWALDRLDKSPCEPLGQLPATTYLVDIAT